MPKYSFVLFQTKGKEKLSLALFNKVIRVLISDGAVTHLSGDNLDKLRLNTENCNHQRCEYNILSEVRVEHQHDVQTSLTFCFNLHNSYKLQNFNVQVLFQTRKTKGFL